MGREEGGEDVAEGDPVMHWHLLMQEGMIWQHLGLLDVEQPWLWPLPLQLHLWLSIAVVALKTVVQRVRSNRWHFNFKRASTGGQINFL